MDDATQRTTPIPPPSSPQLPAVEMPSIKPTMKFDPSQLPQLPEPPPQPTGRTGTVKLSPEELAKHLAQAGITEKSLPRGTVKLPAMEKPAAPPIPNAAPATRHPTVLRPFWKRITSTLGGDRMPSVPPVSGTVPPAQAGGHRRHLVVALAALGGLLAMCLVAAELVLTTNRSWIAPTILSASDPRVVELGRNLEAERAKRSDLSLKHEEMESRLRELRRAIETEESFQKQYMDAMRLDLASQTEALRRLHREIDRKLGEEEQRAKTEGRDPVRDPELDARLQRLSDRVRSLREALTGKHGSYAGLELRRQYDRSVSALTDAKDRADRLTAGLTELAGLRKASDALIATMEASPYFLSYTTRGDVPLAFVPYENTRNVRKLSPLYACRLRFFLCSQIGMVDDVLGGETRATHPLRGHEVRGQLLRISLRENRAAERPVLFAGSPPLFF